MQAAAAATPTPPGSSSSLHLDLKRTDRIKGTLTHPQGKLLFDSTPSNMTLDVADVDAAPGTADELMTLSRHCLPGTGRCPKEEDQLVILTTPMVRLVLLRGKTFALPDDVDVRSKTSITRFFGRWRGPCEGQQCEPWSDELVQLGAEEEHAAIESYYHEYDTHLAALQQLYHTLFQEHAVTGSSHDSSIPLFVTALTHASATGDSKKPPERLFERAADDEEDVRYEAFREAMTAKDWESTRRSLQQFSTNRDVNCESMQCNHSRLSRIDRSRCLNTVCMNGGWVTSYTTNWYGWDNCCGSVCGDNDANVCAGDCGSVRKTHFLDSFKLEPLA